MPQSRRKFITQTLKGAVLIGAGNLLKPYHAWAGLPAVDDVSLRFAIASDGHFGQPNTNFEAMHQQMVDWINTEHGSRDIHFSFINGDLYHDDISFSSAVKENWDKLAMPYYVSHGNHDHSTEEEWEQQWGKPWHYGFTEKDVAFVVLNTANETGGYICPDLEKTTALLKEYEQHEHLFVFMHITPVKWTGAAIECPEIVDLFSRQQNLRAIFHGHDHDEDSVKEKDGKHYFFDSHVGGNWGTAYHGYRIVELLTSGEILTYQMNPQSGMQVNSNSIT